MARIRLTTILWDRRSMVHSIQTPENLSHALSTCYELLQISTIYNDQSIKTVGKGYWSAGIIPQLDSAPTCRQTLPRPDNRRFGVLVL